MKVKIIFLYYFSIFGFVINLQSQDLSLIQSNHEIQKVFNDGNDLFLKNDYQLALLQYEKIENKNSVIWYNLGSCYFNINNYVKALVCWIKARNSCDSWNQFNKINTHISTVLKKLNQHEQSIINKLINILKWFSIKKTQIIVVLFLMILCICMMLIFFNILYYDTKVKNGLIILIIFNILFMIIWLLQCYVISEQLAIICKDNIVYAGPSQTFHKKFQLNLGTQVRIDKNINSMYKITWQDKSGWVIKDSLEII